MDGQKNVSVTCKKEPATRTIRAIHAIPIFPKVNISRRQKGQLTSGSSLKLGNVWFDLLCLKTCHLNLLHSLHCQKYRKTPSFNWGARGRSHSLEGYTSLALLFVFHFCNSPRHPCVFLRLLFPGASGEGRAAQGGRL